MSIPDVRLTPEELDDCASFLTCYSRGAEDISGLVDLVTGVVWDRLRVIEEAANAWDVLSTRPNDSREACARDLREQLRKAANA